MCVWFSSLTAHRCSLCMWGPGSFKKAHSRGGVSTEEDFIFLVRLRSHDNNTCFFHFCCYRSVFSFDLMCADTYHVSYNPNAENGGHQGHLTTLIMRQREKGGKIVRIGRCHVVGNQVGSIWFPTTMKVTVGCQSIPIQACITPASLDLSWNLFCFLVLFWLDTLWQINSVHCRSYLKASVHNSI